MSENKTLTQETQLTRQDKDFIIPPVDVIEDSTGITLYADLPGVSKDKLNLQVETDTLIIEGELNLSGLFGRQRLEEVVSGLHHGLLGGLVPSAGDGGQGKGGQDDSKLYGSRHGKDLRGHETRAQL